MGAAVRMLYGSQILFLGFANKYTRTHMYIVIGMWDVIAVLQDDV